MSDLTVKPITIRGKYNEALVYAKAVEVNCENKIRQYLDHPAFSNTFVRIMPDVHLGKSTVIGLTATYCSLIIPTVIGTDIGCGICACNLGRANLRFDKLDAFIRRNIPAGHAVRSCLHGALDNMNKFISQDNNTSDLSDTDHFKVKLRKLCEKQDRDAERVLASLGTLGGGNHFIEIDIDENHNHWLLIHSGSRVLGANTAEFHENIALRETDEDSPIKYLSGQFTDDYITDIHIVQHYARVNRALMAHSIVCGFFKMDIQKMEYLDCVHNCIDIERSIIRKGAISAQKDEKVIIPFSMSEGAILGIGKGNAEWNYSAPHGSGRKRNRTDSRSLSLDEYRKEMRGIWSSIICKDTLEESPMAYKKARDILEYIGETVQIKNRLKPLYNYKVVN